MYRQKGVSPEILEVIMQSWKSGTGNKYNTYQKQWIQFSSERNQDPLHPHLNHVLNFLHSYQIRNVGYSVLNIICSMLHLLLKLMVSNRNQETSSYLLIQEGCLQYESIFAKTQFCMGCGGSS